MMSGLKKVYGLAALLAILHLLGVGGIVGYLVATGKLTREHVQQMAAVLRGEIAEPQAAEAEEVADVPPPAKSADSIDRDQLQEDLHRHQAERREAELAQHQAAAKFALLKATRAREALEREVASFEAQKRNRKKQEESEGFQKDLALLSSLKPKVSIEYLIQKSTADAAKVLLLMDTRKAKRIIEAARTPAQKKKIAEVMKLLGEMAPAEAELLGGTSKK